MGDLAGSRQWRAAARVLALATVATVGMAVPTVLARSLTIEERVQAQRAVEEVYWRHRIWPEANPEPKPPLSAVMSDAALRAKVEDYLKQSNTLSEVFGRSVTSADLQAEMERMARRTRAPEILRELFAALGDDPVLIAETLVRQRLVGRAIRDAYAARRSKGEAFDAWWATERGEHGTTLAEGTGRHELAVPLGSCTDDTWTKTFGSEVPDGRVGHTAVWTGSEMIIWGGLGSDPVNTGGRYDPATDTWIATSIGQGVPAARSGHTAVWTGTAMIVWGGYYHGSPGAPVNSGGVYDPGTDTWSPTSVGANVPSARTSHTAVWTGTQMIVWGGNFLNTGARYDPATDTWSPTSTGPGVPGGRSSHTAVWTGARMIVWGGSLNAPPFYWNTGAAYDPVGDTWFAISSAAAPSARGGHTAVWSGAKMIVWGGRADAGYFNTGAQYDPATNQWSATPVSANTPSARESHTAVWAGAFMIVWGGFRSGVGSLSTGAIYAPAINQWFPTSTGANVPTTRNGHTAVWTGTEMIVWGGEGGINNSDLVNTGGRYDPNTDTWRVTSTGLDVPSARSGHTALWTGSEMIVWGGAFYFSMNTGGRYDPATDAWLPTSTGPGVPAAGSGNTAVWTGTEMLLWGASVGRYNPATDTWSAISSGAGAPAGRSGHTAVWTGTRMIVWGGEASSAYVSTGGRYDPATDTWSATATVGAPTARRDHTAVWTGTHMIVWGGKLNSAGARTNDGSRYDPVTDAWIAMTGGANVPQPRSSHTAVWTGSRMIVWGGVNSVGLGDGGLYDPAANTWSPVSASGAPDSRYYHTVVWTGSEMIVWGGYSDVFVRNLNTGGRYEPASDSWFATSTGADAPSSRISTAVWTGSQMIVWGGLLSHNSYASTASGGLYCATPGCIGNPARCDDANECTDDSCDGGTNSCAHVSVSCDDGNACTTEHCDPAFGCVVNPLTCPDDHNACTAGFCDPASGCQQVLIDCTDTNACTTDSCDPSSGQCFWTPGAAEIRSVRFASPGTLQWNAAESGAGLHYQVLRGSVAALPVGGSGETCIAQTPDTTAPSGSSPGLGAAFWYLVRSDYAQCNGTYGYQGVNGAPGSERTSAACP